MSQRIDPPGCGCTDCIIGVSRPAISNEEYEMSNQQAVTEIARESPEAAGLVHQILAASAASTQRTMDRLYEGERERRLALEVRIDLFLAAAEDASGGTVREYERAIDLLRYQKGDDADYAKMHRYSDPS